MHVRYSLLDLDRGTISQNPERRQVTNAQSSNSPLIQRSFVCSKMTPLRIPCTAPDAGRRRVQLAQIQVQTAPGLAHFPLRRSFTNTFELVRETTARMRSLIIRFAAGLFLVGV